MTKSITHQYSVSHEHYAKLEAIAKKQRLATGKDVRWTDILRKAIDTLCLELLN